MNLNTISLPTKARPIKQSPWHNILGFSSWEKSLKESRKPPSMNSIEGVMVVNSLTYTQGAREGSPLKVF